MWIHVGCCGWARGREQYFKNFSTIEIQSTFYRLPKLETAIKWKEEAPKEFIYCIKAWQALTHPPTSPTWRRSGMKPEELQKKKFGLLRPTKDNLKAWESTKGICDAMGTKVCVIQCPPTFKFTPENVENMRAFFSKIDRGELLLAWEPRGDWKNHPQEIEKLCEELELIHVVDLMRREPLSKHQVAYVRLHGLNPREYDYKYEYSREELEELARRLKKLGKKHKEVYCMFNNYVMYDSAMGLKRILQRKTT
jgi:uncharacterized protein YecE (DUF72 family)